MIRANRWLIVGGSLSLAASILHVACIVGGPDWYRFFGAGEPLALAAERGSWVPPVLTAAIALVLALWAGYAFAAAGLIRRLPLMRTALLAISAIYLARGAFLFVPDAFARPDLTPGFMFWSSLIVLAIGIIYAVGTWLAWPGLGHKRAYS